MEIFDAADFLVEVSGPFNLEGIMEFGADYAALSIPEAPNTLPGADAQRGLRLTANTSTSAPVGISVQLDPLRSAPLGTSYRTSVDVWHSYPLIGVTGSTTFFNIGLGAGAGWHAASAANPASDPFDGVFWSFTSDAGASIDAWFLGGTPSAPARHLTVEGDLVFLNPTDGSRGSNFLDDPWGPVFPRLPERLAFPPSPGRAWYTWILTRRDQHLTLEVINPLGERYTVMDVPNSPVLLAPGLPPNLGFIDAFTSSLTPPDSFVIFDNLTIEALP